MLLITTNNLVPYTEELPQNLSVLLCFELVHFVLGKNAYNLRDVPFREGSASCLGS